MSYQQSSEVDSGIDVLELLSMFWRARWLIVVATLSIGVITAVYSLMVTEWYRADVVLMPVERRSATSGLGSIGGLANLAGISIGQANNQESIAILRSKEFAREFIDQNKLIPVLLAHSNDTEGGSDIRLALRVFEKLVRTVEFDRKTGLVTVTLRWTDSETVSRWANDYVRGVNNKMRIRALEESARNVEFLRKQIEASPVVAVQQSLGRVLELEMQKFMMAEGNLEFAFKVVDPAYPPDRRYSPQRTLMVILSMVVGGFLSLVFVFLRENFLRPRRNEQGE